MDHLATHSSREADPGPIEEEELANISQSSSLQSAPRAYISNSFVVDHASGTLYDITGDEEVEPNMPFDHDARSETSSIFSTRTFESSFSRMTSASRESLDSVRSMLFAPSFGTLNMNIRELVQYLQSKHRLSKTSILDMTTYHSQSVIKHMFIVLRLKHRRTECWLRLDRRVEDPLNAAFLFASMQGPAKDEVYRIL